jgi:hypothetical protein
MPHFKQLNFGSHILLHTVRRFARKFLRRIKKQNYFVKHERLIRHDLQVITTRLLQILYYSNSLLGITNNDFSLGTTFVTHQTVRLNLSESGKEYSHCRGRHETLSETGQSYKQRVVVRAVLLRVFFTLSWRIHTSLCCWHWFIADANPIKSLDVAFNRNTNDLSLLQSYYEIEMI